MCKESSVSVFAVQMTKRDKLLLYVSFSGIENIVTLGF
jgi:hypothetical protein